MSMTVECGVPLMMGSQWEYAEYEPSNVLIYEKEFHDYVVYYVAQGDSRLFLCGLQHASSTGNAKKRSSIADK